MALLFLGIGVSPAQGPPNATPEQIDQAIQDALAWLATQQQADGSFSGGGYPLAQTAAAVLAFENEGHFPGSGTIYADVVERGLDYIFMWAVKRNISADIHGDPDSDGDGIGIFFRQDYNNKMYDTGMIMQTIIASNAPNRLVTTGTCSGMTYREVMIDVIDYIAFGQIDGGTGRGGWTYGEKYKWSGKGDNSISQWPVLGLVVAQQWGLHAPQFVKDELDIWVHYIQYINHVYGHGTDSP